MYKTKRRNNLVVLFGIFLLLSGSVFAQNKDKKGAITGTPILWEDVNISERNLLLGPGGTSMKPNLSKITFIEEEKAGYSKKYRIKDGAGKTWVAKIGVEAQPETASVRLVWGLGYKTEINYLVPTITIPGIGTFTNVRLEARPDNVERLEEWEWKENPFAGSKELQGLKIMMAFLTNWDLKNTNNKILAVNNGGRQELHYVISHLGATIGKTGNIPLFWRLQRSRNEPADYAKAKFVTEVKDGRVKYSYGGKMRELFDDITIEQSRWLVGLLTQLTDDQIRDAFRSANYSADEVEILTESVKNRIAELSQAVG